VGFIVGKKTSMIGEKSDFGPEFRLELYADPPTIFVARRARRSSHAWHVGACWYQSLSYFYRVEMKFLTY